MAMAMFSPYKANEGPRDASFSSYLDTTESANTPSLARELFTPRKSVGRRISQAQRRGELDVFGADRYFNEKINDSPFSKKDDRGTVSNHYHRDFRRVKRDDLLERKSSRSNVISTTSSSSTKSPTPSLKSGRSFNSQIGLFFPRKGSFLGHKIFSGFQCKGSCFDKKSVSTTNTQHMVQPSSKSYQDNGNYWHMKKRISHQQNFAFPVIDTASLSFDDDDQCCKSMDGFGFHQLGKQETAQNLDINHSTLAWNAIPNSPIATTPFPFPFALKRETSSCNVRDEDECSDTSSDLFEIENLTGVPGIQTSTTPCYEPNEGNIQ